MYLAQQHWQIFLFLESSWTLLTSSYTAYNVYQILLLSLFEEPLRRWEALDVFFPAPAGILILTAAVRFVFFLCFLNHERYPCKHSAISAAAIQWEQIRYPVKVGQALSHSTLLVLVWTETVCGLVFDLLTTMNVTIAGCLPSLTGGIFQMLFLFSTVLDAFSNIGWSIGNVTSIICDWAAVTERL